MGPDGDRRMYSRVVAVYVAVCAAVLLRDLMPAGWAGDLLAAVLASGGLMLSRVLRTGRFAVMMLATGVLGHLSGDAAAAVLWHDGAAGKVTAWLLPPVLLAGVFGVRWARQARAFRQDQVTAAARPGAAGRSRISPGSWPGSR